MQATPAEIALLYAEGQCYPVVMEIPVPIRD